MLKKNRVLPSIGDSWCEAEFAAADFGDRRLTCRLICVAEELAKSLTSTINRACRVSATVKGAYRLFSNTRVRSKEIFRSHVRSTIERLERSAAKTIFLIQDTTYFEYGRYLSVEGLGPIAGKNLSRFKGLLMHSSMLVDDKNISLGLLTQSVWARQQSSAQTELNGHAESAKWFLALDQAVSLIPKPDLSRVVTLADRESDIVEFLQFLDEQKMRYVIRGRNYRLVRDGDDMLVGVQAYLRQQPVASRYEIEVPIKSSRGASRNLDIRKAKVSVRYARVELHSHRLPRAMVCPFAIWVEEEKPPKGAEPVKWLLLTSEKIDSAESALEKINWYKKRWHIENYHRVLKGGCQVEKCRLQSADRLEKYITLMCVVAWRVYWCLHNGRNNGDIPCTEAFTNGEWKILYLSHHQTKKLPKKVPTLGEAIVWVARLGGHMCRKGDGPPGVVTFWRGLQRLQDMAASFELLHGLS
jgi:hypothetical protein